MKLFDQYGRTIAPENAAIIAAKVKVLVDILAEQGYPLREIELYLYQEIDLEILNRVLEKK